MDAGRRLLLALNSTRIGLALNVPRRVAYALGYYLPKLRNVIVWGFRSRESTNYTYDLTDDSLLYLAHTIAIVSGVDVRTAQRYIAEARSDNLLRETVINAVQNSPFRYVSDARCEFGRRLGWYALVRILKPRVVIETGVDKGLGAILLCAALLKNQSDGANGKYFGTDIDPHAGWLLKSPYAEVGSVLIGDSVQSLHAFPHSIDLFINDSDHSADYEYREYQAILGKLTERSIVLGDNAHVSSMLAKFAEQNGMDFVFFS